MHEAECKNPDLECAKNAGDCLDSEACCWPDTCNDYGSCYVTAGTCVKSGEDNCGGDCWDYCDAGDIGCKDDICPTYCGYPGGEVEDDKLEPGTCNCAEKACPAVVCATPTPDPVMPAGNFDGCDSSNLYGWACDADNYATPLDIHLYDDPAGAGSAATGSRPHTAKSLCGDLKGAKQLDHEPHERSESFRDLRVSFAPFRVPKILLSLSIDNAPQPLTSPKTILITFQHSNVKRENESMVQ